MQFLIVSLWMIYRFPQDLHGSISNDFQRFSSYFPAMHLSEFYRILRKSGDVVIIWAQAHNFAAKVGICLATTILLVNRRG
jgi:hypothetical protein